jgi:4-amino-4-deoxy-L-arabinose transferase-like glycosyltransferase
VLTRKHLGGAATLWLLALILVQAAVFVPMALTRVVDPDEGWYGFSAVRVMRGDVPYDGFFYPQMPLVPYVYGPWNEVFSTSLYSERLCSSVLAVAVGVLLYLHGRRFAGAGAALAGALAYASSALVFAWYSTVKTYALTTLLLLAALVLLDRPERKGVTGRLLGGGLLCGLAVSSRLLAAAALPAFAVVAVRRGSRSAAAFASGVVLGVLPAAFFLVRDPDEFVFDNLGYHAKRSSAGLVGDLPQKVHVVGNLFGLGAADVPAGLQFLALVACAAACAVLARRVVLPAAVAALVGGASIVPTPAYVQYFSVTVPFLILGILEVVPTLRRRLHAPPRVALATVGVAAALWALAAAVDLRRYGSNHADPGADIAAVHRVERAVEAESRPGETVLTTWPGYLIGTSATPVEGTGLANFVLDVANRSSRQEVVRHGLATTASIERLIRTRRVRLIVFRPWAASAGPRWPDVISRSGYRLVRTVGTARIYRLPSR